jgi:CRP/FNR family transcriptional regulator, cyclic AMP receptor protein
MARTKLEDVLALVPMFHALSRRQLRALAARCETADYMAGHSIVRKGEPGDAFYVLLSGQAKVTNGSRFLARLLAGDHFGEIAVIDGGERTATVTTETPVTVAVLTRKAFREVLHDDPEIAYELIVELARMFRRVDASIEA